MKTSYYLTPDLRQKLVGLNFRDAQGKYNVWQDQLEIIEQDPSKGESSFRLIIFTRFIMFLNSSHSSRRSRTILINERLSQATASHFAD